MTMTAAKSMVGTTIPSPCEMPNGLQWHDDKLYVMDQLTDNVYVVDENGAVLQTVYTATENGSGITFGDGHIWTGSNGTTVSRPYRSTDTHLGYVIKVDADTGETVDRWRTPDGGGIHGIEWDHDENLLWVTAFSPKAIILVDPSDNFKVVHKFEVELERLHGLALEGDDGIWCAPHDRQRSRALQQRVRRGDGPHRDGLRRPIHSRPIKERRRALVRRRQLRRQSRYRNQRRTRHRHHRTLTCNRPIRDAHTKTL